MPSSMPHLMVAKKVNPNASIAFYAGNLAVDASRDTSMKAKAHYENISDIETILKKLAGEAKNDYLKGILLHLYVDWKWKSVYMTDFAAKTGDKWYLSYRDEIGKITSYAFHTIEWASELYEQLENWNYDGFIETEFIKKEAVKDYIFTSKKWQMDNKLEPSTAFPPALVEQFADDTAKSFVNWFAEFHSKDG